MTVANVHEKGQEAQKHLIVLDSKEAQTLVQALEAYTLTNKRDRKAKALWKALAENLNCYF